MKVTCGVEMQALGAEPVETWATVKLLLFSVMIVAAASASASGQTAHPIDRFAWLVGGSWSADASKLGNGMKQIVTRYQWAPNNAFITFSTTFTTTSSSVVNYSGNLFAKPASKESADPVYEMWYMDAKNAITDGTVVPGPNGDWSLTFVSEGQAYRVEVVRSGDDSYRWALSAQSGTAWNPLFFLDFVRVR